jgi:hypothetical protein
VALPRDLSSNVVKLARVRRRQFLTSTGTAVLALVVGVLLGAALFSVLR